MKYGLPKRLVRSGLPQLLAILAIPIAIGLIEWLFPPSGDMPTYVAIFGSVLLLSLVFSYLMGRTEQRVVSTLDNRLPEIRYLQSKQNVELELTELARVADGFLFCTGGLSRAEEYLRVIESRVRDDGLTYWRLISGEKVSMEVFQHLKNVVTFENKVSLGYWDDTSLGHIMVTKQALAIVFPVPGGEALPGGDLNGVIIPSAEVASRVHNYLLQSTERVTHVRTVADIERLFVPDLRS